MVLQLFSYIDKILHGFARNYGFRRHSWPRLLPLVLYHGRAKRKNPVRSLAGLTVVGKLLALLPGPSFDFAYKDLSNWSVTEYIAGMTKARSRFIREAWGGLFAMYLATRGEAAWPYVPALLKAFPPVTQFAVDLRAYIVSGWQLDSKKLMALMEAIDPTEGEIMMTLGKQLMAEGVAAGLIEGRIEGKAEGRIEGKAEGRIEGEAKGRIEGEAKGQAKALTTMLRQRFKSVPRQVTKRIAQASSKELNVWLKRVLTAESPEAVVA